MASLSFGEVDRGVVARLRNDPVIKAITGVESDGGARVTDGWPATLLERPNSAAFPRITTMRVASDVRSPGRGTVRIRIDEWGWNDLDVIDQLDNRVMELLDEQSWTHEQARLWSFSVGSSNRSGGAPRSRLHTFEIHVT